MQSQITFQSLLSLAQYYLAKRDHSAYELTQKLKSYCQKKKSSNCSKHPLTKRTKAIPFDNAFVEEDFDLSRESYTLSNTEQQIIDEIIAYCTQMQWLDDLRFTHSYLKSKSQKGQGKNKIKQGLFQKGISKPLIEKACSEVTIDWFVIAKETAEKKFPNLADCLTVQDKSKVQRFLLSRGFSFDEINTVFDDSN